MLVGLNLVDRVRRPEGLDLVGTYSSYSSDVGRYPLPADRLAKARQWCRALQRQIRAVWWSTVETQTQPGPGGSQYHETEAVMVETAMAVAAVQVLYETFIGAYPRTDQNDPKSSQFELHSYSVHQGQVVSGLKLIRNGEMHANSILIPDIDRFVGVPFDDGTQGFRVFPVWMIYQSLPLEVREARYPPKKPGKVGKLKTNQAHHDHYKQVVAEVLVVETLLDALRFFADCDPRIVQLGDDGEPRHFPLPPICERDYERRHPAWPTRTEIDGELRELSESNPPDGVRRICVVDLNDPSGAVIAHCGHTQLEHGHTHIFTESPKQIIRDIAEHGFEYWVEIAERAYKLIVADDGSLQCDAGESEPATYNGRHDDLDLPWREWFAMTLSDAFQYKQQRRPPR